jgi:hypothetical protein
MTPLPVRHMVALTFILRFEWNQRL